MATSLDSGALKYEFQWIWRISEGTNNSEIESKMKQLECQSKFSRE